MVSEVPTIDSSRRVSVGRRESGEQVERIGIVVDPTLSDRGRL